MLFLYRAHSTGNIYIFQARSCVLCAGRLVLLFCSLTLIFSSIRSVETLNSLRSPISYLESIRCEERLILFYLSQFDTLSRHWYLKVPRSDRSKARRDQSVFRTDTISPLDPYLFQSRKDEEPVLLLGDFNIEPASKLFNYITSGMWVGHWQFHLKIACSLNGTTFSLQQGSGQITSDEVSACSLVCLVDCDILVCTL